VKLPVWDLAMVQIRAAIDGGWIASAVIAAVYIAAAGHGCRIGHHRRALAATVTMIWMTG